jgi:hypothetical protein
MTSISPHTTRAPGTILTATIYNFDHGNHIANAQALNNTKVEGPGTVVADSVAVFDGTSGLAIKSGGGAPVLAPIDTGDISDEAITYAKIQGVSASKRLLGRFSSGAGVVEELTFTQGAAVDRNFINDITAGYTALVADKGYVIMIAAGTGTLAFTAAATLGAAWFCYVQNLGTGDVTLNPDGADLIDGLASWVLYPGGTILVQCNGSNLRSLLLSPMRKVFTANGTLTKPGVGTWADIEGWGSGGAGARGGAGNGGAGGGGGSYKSVRLPLTALGATESVTVGAAPAGHTTGTTGSGAAGNNTTLGSLFTAYAGGGGGLSGTRGGGGGGGGLASIGGTGTSTGASGGEWHNGAGGGDNTKGGSADNGGAGGGGAGSGSNAGAGGDANYGGAGGGGGSDGAGNGGAGGVSVFGGGGGGGGSDAGTVGAAGTSTYGGNGGIGATAANNAGNGVAPGGGGGGSESGTSGNGGRGELRVVFS